MIGIAAFFVKHQLLYNRQLVVITYELIYVVQVAHL